MGIRTIIFWVVLVLAFVGAGVYFAYSDKGAIDVNQQIKNTNQSGFREQVLPDTRATAPNGGLRPMGGEPIPEAPAPVPQASSTEASSTDATASSTEGAPAGDIPQGQAPEGTDTGAQQ